jgi:LysR family hydrogen peroxide-inducible transcriptional activator
VPSITQLRYICAVDKLKHFGKAALECYVSQPSLSAQIQKVELEIGFYIFDRTKKPLAVTNKGNDFIKQAERVLGEYEKLLHMSKMCAAEVSGEFRLGIIPTLIPYVLPRFIESFSTNYPKVKLIIDELKTEDIISTLKTDKLDAGILATPLNTEGIKKQVLFYEPFYAYVNPRHHLANKDEIKINQLTTDDLWLLKDGHCFRNQVINFCSLDDSDGMFNNVVFEGGSLDTLRFLVRDSGGYTLVPQLFTENLPEQERAQMIKKFAKPVPIREISIVYSRTQWKTDILAALEKIIKQTLPSNAITMPNHDYEIISIK